MAQVTGVVNDVNNFPEMDTEVVVKGTGKVAFTDENGNFTIDAKVGDTLIVNGKEFKVTSNKLGVLKPINDQINLEEAVVTVAFGKQRKEAVVGSISTIDEKVLEKQQASNALTALQGTTSGVNIITSGGQPGANPSIRIRGIGSINASAEPLIVVDGVPFNGALSMISQDMIQSMSVLKDAGSTALYGARAANGVILIETKKGKFNVAPQISFTSQFGVADQAVKMHKRIGSDDFVRLTWEALKNDKGATAASNELISKLGYNPYGPSFPKPIDENGNLVNGAKLLWDTDWEGALINKAAVRREYSLNVDGGSASTIYSYGASYLNQEGSVKTSKFERTTVRANITNFAADWLELGFNTLAAFGDENGPTQSGTSYQSPIQWINSVSSIYPLYRRDEAGSLIYDALGNPIYDYGNNEGLVNGTRPVLGIENAVGALTNYKLKNRRTNVNASGYAKVKFTDYLSLRSNLSYQSYLYDYTSISSNSVGNAESVGGRIEKNRDTQTTKNLINSLNFDKTFGGHTVRVDAIMEMYDYAYETMLAQGTGYITGITTIGGTTTPEKIGGAIYRERNLSYMARAAYDFNRKYYAEGTFKKEASTRFNRDERWGDFYAVGAGWVISKENFLANSRVVNNLKLRASYGETGNNRTTSYFPYAQNYASGLDWANIGSTGLNATALVDYGITWEKQQTLNIGLDFGFFKNRITGSVEYYERTSKDLIMGTALAPSGGMGFASITTNIGAMKNSGFDVNLNSVNIRNNNFEWTTNINVGTVKNKITKLNGAENIISGSQILEVGGNRYEFYIWEWAGVDPDDGKAMWYMDDANGNKVTTKDYSQAQRYKTGKSALPDFEGGFTNYFRYKNIDLNVLFNFSVGSYVYDSSYAGLMSSGERGYQWSADITNRWTKPGDITDTPALTTISNNNNTTSTRFLFKNDYLRLKALNIGYNFTASTVRQIGIKGLRIYFQGDNLLTFQSHKGIDPEQSVAGTTDNRSYQQRIYTLGFNVKL